MPDIKLIDKNVYNIKGTPEAGRWIHLATLHRGLREYIAFTDRQTGQYYIEEVAGSRFERIEDTELWNELSDYVQKNIIILRRGDDPFDPKYKIFGDSLILD